MLFISYPFYSVCFIIILTISSSSTSPTNTDSVSCRWMKELSLISAIFHNLFFYVACHVLFCKVLQCLAESSCCVSSMGFYPLNLNSNALLNAIDLPILFAIFTLPKLCRCLYSKPVELFPYIYFHIILSALLKSLYALLAFALFLSTSPHALALNFNIDLNYRYYYLEYALISDPHVLVLSFNIDLNYRNCILNTNLYQIYHICSTMYLL